MALLDIDALLQGIDPDAPCGEDLEYDAAFIALEQKAKGTPEKQIGGRIEPPQPPNWKEVRGDVLDLLGRTIDLRLLLELIRANLSLEGVTGLKQGLALLQGALENYWDTIHPQLDPDDDNDPTLRVNILEGLSDADSVLRSFLNAPLVESRAMGRFSLRKIQVATGKLTPSAEEEDTPLSTIQAAFADADPGHLQETRDALKDSLASIVEIERFVTEQVGVGNGPNLAPLRSLLKEALHVLEENLTRRGLGDDAGADEAEGGEGQAVAGAAGARQAQGSISGLVNNRQDVIRSLDLICDYYAKYEPSSPIPLLARRAKRLVNMDFMEIINDLAPEGVHQVEIIKGQEPGEE